MSIFTHFHKLFFVYTPHTQTLSVRRIQTLSHLHIVHQIGIRIFSNKGINCVVLIVGQAQGSISVYSSPLSHTHPLHFTFRAHFNAHTNGRINGLHLHYHNPLFVSHCGHDVKVWSFKDITAPCLIQCFPPQPNWVCSALYSESGLLLTAYSGSDGMIRVHGKEPQFSLRWSFQTFGYVYSVGWSPSNRIGVVFRLSYAEECTVQVWDSSFQTIFKLKQDNICEIYRFDGLVFASDDVLLCSGGASKNVYLYRMSKPKVMNVFMDTDVLPFCRDVLKIIIQYLPFVTRVTHEKLPDEVGIVTALSSEVVGAQCKDGKLHLYKVNEQRWLASLPHKIFSPLVTCVYPCSGNESGFILASSPQDLYHYVFSADVNVSVITLEVCILFCLEVFQCSILNFSILHNDVILLQTYGAPKQTVRRSHKYTDITSKVELHSQQNISIRVARTNRKRKLETPTEAEPSAKKGRRN